MPSLFAKRRRRNVFKVGAACTRMGRLRRNVNVGYVRFWPLAAVGAELKIVLAGSLRVDLRKNHG